MPISIDKKLWPLLILQVLGTHEKEGAEQNETGDTFLTQKQILEFLKADFGVETQRKAIADNLSRLYEAGMLYPELGFELQYIADERQLSDQKQSADSSRSDEVQLVRKGWRLVKDHEFETSEIRMLIDAVIASTVIPPKQVKMLVERLQDLSPDEIVIPNIEREGHFPAINSDFFYNIELLNEAIQEGHKVSFVLGSFGKDKKLHKKLSGENPRKHTVNPVQLLISKGHYYLLATFPPEEEIYKFRIDLMLDIKIIDNKTENTKAQSSKKASNFNVLKYREQHSYMMSGKLMNVVLRIKKSSLHTLFDQFGPNIAFTNETDETIDAEFKSALYSVLFWALQYYRSVEVISPPELREKLETAGRVITKMYEGKPGKVSFKARQAEARDSIS